MLADLFLSELATLNLPDTNGVVVLGRKLAALYKEQHETLAGIATSYVKAARELHDLKKIHS